MGKLITLTSDFGLSDGYVAAMKGVILSISPDCKIIDITHDIEPQQILPAAIVLATAFEYFPDDTIHVAVVDPGVGTDRPILAVRILNQFFIAPDNGLLGFILEKDPKSEVRRLENRSLFLENISRTFHGRDVLAPVAAHLAEGVPFEEVGPEAKKHIQSPFPRVVPDGSVLRGQIVYRDHFGNLMTNIKIDDISRFDAAKIVLQAGYTTVRGLSESYSDAEKGELLSLIGSAGYLEIALREGSAADKLRFPLGTDVIITEEDE